MTSASAPRFLVAATSSGSGKTTIACGLMRALSRRGMAVQACKCGPDYIDPMFHRRVLGTPSRNLDLFFADENTVCELVAEGSRNANITVIEGVMGYYDGIASGSDASSYALAHATNTPAILVVEAHGRALSVAAEVAGFAGFRQPSHVAGVIVNRCTKGYYPRLRSMIETETSIPVLGYVPALDDEINLMTLHKSKGLEFSIVFHLDMYKWIMPNEYGDGLEDYSDDDMGGDF